MKARITYTADFIGKEGYRIDIDAGDGWEFDSFCPIVRRENASENEAAYFVHVGILNKLAALKKLGYSIHWAL